MIYTEEEPEKDDEEKETPNERYWREMRERAKQRRDWEDRGEPVGF